MAFLDKLGSLAKNLGDKTNEAIAMSKLNGKITSEKVNDNITQDGKLPKASVIFWIDLDKSKSNSGKTIRNVKAKVSINKEGKIKVLEYNKKQPLLITNKIDKCLKTFRVKPEWIASGRVKVGENIVFLRFLDEY